MADDKRKVKQDRKLVAAGQPYEVKYFAKKHGGAKAGMTLQVALEIIRRNGPSRAACDTAAVAYLASLAAK